jgi:PAS domain S-box-containing protein
MIERAGDAIFGRTVDGVVATWNKGAERIFGYTAGEIVGRSGSILEPPRSAGRFTRVLGRIRRGAAFVSLDALQRHKDGHLVHVSLTLAPIRNSANRLIGLSTIARDVSEKVAAQEALRRSERELADLFEQAPMVLLWVTRQGRIERGNLTARECLRSGSGNIAGRHVGDFILEQDLVADALARLAARRTVYNLQASLRQADGSKRTVLIDANGLWEEGQFVHSRWFIRDITARKELEREVLAITERERRHVAQDLHDGLGQHLSGIAYLSDALRQELLEKCSIGARDAARLTRLAQEAIQLTRDLARGLLPVRPDPEGFADAVRDLAARMRHVFKINCRFVSRGSTLIHDETMATHLYRIAQEAVTNAIRHGKATSVEVMLIQTGRRLRLIVRDNGRGMPAFLPRRQGMGLRVMQYRADLIHGSLSVHKQPQGGTEVLCAISLPKSGAVRAGPQGQENF